MACKLPKRPVNFQCVAGKLPNLASSLGTITLKQYTGMIKEKKCVFLKNFVQRQSIGTIYFKFKLFLNPGTPKFHFLLN